MLRAMGLRDWWSKVAGPPHVRGGHGDDPGEVDAALREDYAEAHPAESQYKRDELAEDLAAAPVAATPFSGSGQADASEIEIGLEEDVEPQEDEGPLSEEDQER
jgi:hypothetical protein